MMKDRRIGWVTIDEYVIRDSIDNGQAAALFAGSVPIDVQRNFYERKVTYLLWNSQFDQISEGSALPEYVATFHKGKKEPTWQRKEGGAA